MNDIITTSWHSYPSIYHIGHKAASVLLDQDVIVEEKIDGSQISFGWFPELANDGESALRIKSKGAIIYPETPPAMFKSAVETIVNSARILHPGWTYRGEVLAKPKHNTLAYDRIPLQGIIIFDINSGEEQYLSWECKMAEAARLNLECVPRLFQGLITSYDQFVPFLQTTSCLGGQKVEGVVIKPVNYDVYGVDKKVVMAKYVSEEFKEAHSKAWKVGNPGRSDVIIFLQDKYNVPARWNKSIQHMTEDGLLEGVPRDIGKLIAAIQQDVEKEEKDDIKEQLWRHFWPHIRRGITHGFPQYYKDLLLRRTFETTEVAPPSTEGAAIEVAEDDGNPIHVGEVG